MNQPRQSVSNRAPKRVDTDPRFRRRRMVVARSKRRRMLIGAGAVAGLALTVWAMFFSPLLDVREVKVVGAVHTTDDEVAQAAGLLRSSQNLLLLPTDEIAGKVAALPWIAEVDVDRMLPGTVRIKIVERAPALVLSLGTASWTIDARGNVLASGEAVKGLPVLAGVEVGSIEPGLQLMTEESAAALRTYRALPKAIKRKVVGIFAPTVERISLSLADGTTIRYGAAEQLKDKNEVLKVLLGRLAAEGTRVSYIDVRVPTSPAMSPDTSPASKDEQNTGVAPAP